MKKSIHLLVIMPAYNKARDRAFLYASTQLQSLHSQYQRVQVILCPEHSKLPEGATTRISVNEGNLPLYPDNELQADCVQHFLPLVG